MKCNICGKEFDARWLSLVFYHEHNWEYDEINPSKAIGIKGKSDEIPLGE